MKGELVAKGSNWLIAKDTLGYYKLYAVQPGRKAIVDGVPTTLDQLKLGTMLTSTATTTETPLVDRTTTITQGTVFWASPKSIIVTLQSGENRQYEVPDGFKFNVDGKQLEAMELRAGMKLTGTKIVRAAARRDHARRRRDGHGAPVGLLRADPAGGSSPAGEWRRSDRTFVPFTGSRSASTVGGVVVAGTTPR